MTGRDTAVLFVLAGPNGGGKSSVGGQVIRAMDDGDYYNPDEVARDLLRTGEASSAEAANSIAWEQMVRLLDAAIASAQVFAFESTLGGRTITNRLLDAATTGAELNIWYVALDTVEDHLSRVAARVTQGGHPIPEQQVRDRYDSSPVNLARLVPHAAAIRVFDNTAEAGDGEQQPRLVCEIRRGTLTYCCSAEDVPDWATIIIEAAEMP